MISKAAQEIRKNIARDILGTTTIVEKRKQWEDATRDLPTPVGVSVRNLSMGGVPCLLSTPYELTSDNVIVYCHGGGLVEGSVETFRIWTSRLARHTGCRVVSVGYRLAPEFPHPAAIEDVLRVCHSLLSDAGYSSEICIGGDSTGCILALSALLNLRPLVGNKISSAFLLSPSIDLSFSGESIKSNALLDPVVSLDVLKHYAKLYGGGRALADPDVSPLFAEFHNLPPLLVMADNHEILLDDSVRLVDKVNSSAGLARLYVAEGLWHVWPCWGEFPESMAALDRIRQHVFRNT